MTDSNKSDEKEENDDLVVDDPWGEDEITTTTRMEEVAPTLPVAHPRDRATLTIVSGPETGRVYSWSDDEVLIGRGRICNIRLSDTSVSRTHARISRSATGSALVIEDLGSANGTFVEGYRVRRRELDDGDRVQFGPSARLRFALTDDVGEGLLRHLYESSTRDPVTDIFNRKHFNERLHEEISFAVRHGTEVNLVIFDIDHFKQVNDRHGHRAGDQVLHDLARLVGRTIRAEDIFARYGGEEFGVIARGIDLRGSVAMAERIRSVVESSRISFDGRTIPITISLGIATLDCCEGAKTVDGMMEVADRRLSEAKARGRNCAVGPSGTPREPSP